jgi:hypothetical protein
MPSDLFKNTKGTPSTSLQLLTSNYASGRVQSLQNAIFYLQEFSTAATRFEPAVDNACFMRALVCSLNKPQLVKYTERDIGCDDLLIEQCVPEIMGSGILVGIELHGRS